MDDESRKRSIVFVVTVLQFVMPFMFSSIGVSLPAIGREFGASETQLSLVEAAYIGTCAALLLPFGRFADISGREPVFKLSILLNTIIMIFLGFSFNIESFIGMRVIQGTIMAMSISTNMALLTDAIPREERGRAMGIAVAAVYAGLAAGPFVGGIITTHAGWRWIFHGGAVLLGLCYIVSLKRLDSHFNFRQGQSFDWIGAILVSVSILLLIVGGTHLDSGLPGILMLSGGVICFILFIVVEMRTAEPILNMDMFTRNKVFARAAAVQYINYAGTFGITFLFSLYLQTAKAMTPQQAGVVLIIQPIVQALLSPVFGRLADKYSARLIANLGLLCCTIGTAMGVFVQGGTSMHFIYGMFVVLGVGFSMFASPNMAILMGSVCPSRLGIASAISGGLRNIGMVSSMVIITICFSLFMGDSPVKLETLPEYMQSMNSALLILACLGALGVFLSFLPIGKAQENVFSDDTPDC
jgi:MFS family permease